MLFHTISILFKLVYVVGNWLLWILCISSRDKSSSTADAVQVEANLQKELSDHLHLFNLENVGQGHRIRLSFAMAPLNGKYQRLWKSYLTVLRQLSRFPRFRICHWKSRSTSHSTTLGMTPFSGKHQDINIKGCMTHFLANSHHCRDISIWNIWPWKGRLRSPSKMFSMTPVDGKYQNLQTYLLHLFIFARVWPVLTKVTPADIHRNRQSHSYRRNRRFT